MVIFRENTEDVYAGIEWPVRKPKMRKKSIRFLKEEMGVQIPGSGRDRHQTHEPRKHQTPCGQRHLLCH